MSSYVSLYSSCACLLPQFFALNRWQNKQVARRRLKHLTMKSDEDGAGSSKPKVPGHRPRTCMTRPCTCQGPKYHSIEWNCEVQLWKYTRRTSHYGIRTERGSIQSPWTRKIEIIQESRVDDCLTETRRISSVSEGKGYALYG